MKKLSVLVVDDSKVQCEHAVSLCQKVGVDSLSFAYDGKEALVQLRAKAVDVVLVDLEMPVMDGVELISYIAAEELAKSIIILSAKDASLIASVGTMAEADGLIVLATLRKPLTEDAVMNAFLQFDIKGQGAEDESDELLESCQINLAEAICNEQLYLHYQPKLTTKGLLLKGLEALARWQHPEQGAIPPVYFIAQAESQGLIGILTFHLLEKALKQKMLWQQKGLNFNLAFNLSPLSLSNPDFADWMFDLVQSYHIKPSDLTFEVTENILLGDVAKSIQTLARLRLRGFLIAIDDYGSGFANAEQLSRIPATELKIDRSMIDGVANKSQLQTILSSTVKLAADLGLSTVAEGVETREDFHVIEGLGVDLVQGYYFSKPLSGESLPTWISGDLRQIREKS